ncbi:hypothetical protein KM043_010133 [Ampulex compressa]|nr:hypothetical protein KM043_010133 [Ampulex compressa]
MGDGPVIFEVGFDDMNKNLLRCSALWPFQSFRERLLIATLLCLIAGTHALLQILAFARVIGERMAILAFIPPLTLDLDVIIRIINAALTFGAMKGILSEMGEHVKAPKSEAERAIYRKFAQRGKRATLIFSCKFIGV